MGRHILDYQNIVKIPVSMELASSGGKGSCKSLSVNINLDTREINYEVKEGLEAVLDTDGLQEAVDYYNDLP